MQSRNSDKFVVDPLRINIDNEIDFPPPPAPLKTKPKNEKMKLTLSPDELPSPPRLTNVYGYFHKHSYSTPSASNHENLRQHIGFDLCNSAFFDELDERVARSRRLQNKNIQQHCMQVPVYAASHSSENISIEKKHGPLTTSDMTKCYTSQPYSIEYTRRFCESEDSALPESASSMSPTNSNASSSSIYGRHGIDWTKNSTNKNIKVTKDSPLTKVGSHYPSAKAMRSSKIKENNIYLHNKSLNYLTSEHKQNEFGYGRWIRGSNGKWYRPDDLRREAGRAHSIDRFNSRIKQDQNDTANFFIHSPPTTNDNFSKKETKNRIIRNECDKKNCTDIRNLRGVDKLITKFSESDLPSSCNKIKKNDVIYDPDINNNNIESKLCLNISQLSTVLTTAKITIIENANDTLLLNNGLNNSKISLNSEAENLIDIKKIDDEVEPNIPDNNIKKIDNDIMDINNKSDFQTPIYHKEIVSLENDSANILFISKEEESKSSVRYSYNHKKDSVENKKLTKSFNNNENEDIPADKLAEIQNWIFDTESTHYDFFAVKLHRNTGVENGSVGIILTSIPTNLNSNHNYEEYITIQRIITGSIADYDGRLLQGDRVFYIQETCTRNMSAADARKQLKISASKQIIGKPLSTNSHIPCTNATAIKSSASPLHFYTFNDDPKLESYNTELMEVFLQKSELGVGLSLDGGRASRYGDRQIVVKKVFSVGSAARSGKIHAGDEIYSINGKVLCGKTQLEAWKILKSCPEGKIISPEVGCAARTALADRKKKKQEHLAKMHEARRTVPTAFVDSVPSISSSNQASTSGVISTKKIDIELKDVPEIDHINYL